MLIRCTHCGYEWAYKGKKIYYVTCPSCLLKVAISINKHDLKICLICKKLFEKLDSHHVSYKYNLVIGVCEKCHYKIHKTKLYELFKPIDKIHKASK